MFNQSFNKQKSVADLLKKSGKNIDSESINAAMNGDGSALLQKLDSADRAKVENLLNDKQALQKLLSSDAAQQLLKQLSGNGK